MLRMVQPVIGFADHLTAFHAVCGLRFAEPGPPFHGGREAPKRPFHGL